jgi:stage II sporulation protein D
MIFLRAGVIFAAIFLLLGIASASESPYYSDSPEKGIDYYLEKTISDKNNKMYLLNLASVYKEFGENRKAFELYRAVLDLNDREVRAHFELAKMYYFLGAYNYAEEEINYFLRWGITNWEVFFWQGSILLAMEKFDSAEAALEKAAELDSRRAAIYVKMAELYAEKGDLHTAIERYKAAMKKDKTYTEELTRKIAWLNEKEGDYAAAYVSWRQANEIDTKDSVAAGKMQQFVENVPDLKKKVDEFNREKQLKRDTYIPPDKAPIEGAAHMQVVEAGLMQDVGYIYMKAGSDFTVLDEQKNTVFEGIAGKEYFIEADKNGKKASFAPVDGSMSPVGFKRKIYIVKGREGATMAVYNVQYGEGFYWSGKSDTTYRGDFKVVLSQKALNLVNIVNMEEYLYGVVPSEMPPGWNLEALKAQTVAARTYTYRHLNRHRKQDFDVCSQQHCAVYKGIYSESESTNKAVDETKGEVLYGSNYNIMDTFYSHCCGGHTTDIKEAWGMKSIKSLEGAFDAKTQNWGEEWKFPLDPFFLEEWVRTMPAAYCKATGNNETSFRWIRYLDADSLEYYVNKRYKIGKIRDLKPLKRAKSGALVKLYIEGDKGNQTVNFDSMRNILGKMRSNVIKWEYRRDAKGFIKDIYIYGAGWGHGVGMCQRGANGMAESGKAYNEILYHYFPGSYIKKKY